MAENTTFTSTAEALLKGMQGVISSETIVGKPIILGDTTLLPLVDISFGMGCGSMLGEKKKNAAGGLGGKMSPSAVLVIKGDTVRMVSVKNQDAISKLLDMVPDYVNKFMGIVESKKDPEAYAAKQEAKEKAAKEMEDMLNESV